MLLLFVAAESAAPDEAPAPEANAEPEPEIEEPLLPLGLDPIEPCDDDA